MAEREDVGVVVEHDEVLTDVHQVEALRLGELDIRIQPENREERLGLKSSPGKQKPRDDLLCHSFRD